VLSFLVVVVVRQYHKQVVLEHFHHLMLLAIV
jgi:hypothetical protein